MLFQLGFLTVLRYRRDVYNHESRGHRNPYIASQSQQCQTRPGLSLPSVTFTVLSCDFHCCPHQVGGCLMFIAPKSQANLRLCALEEGQLCVCPDIAPGGSGGMVPGQERA